MLPTIWGIYVTWIMYWYWIYHANTGGRNMSLKLYIRIGLMLPTICGVHVSHIYMLILEICCQQFGEYVSVEYIYWYWIYHANTWALNVSWRVSVCPSGTGLGNVQFRKCLFVLEICCQQFGEYVSVEYICWYWIYHANTWVMNVSWMVSVCPSGTRLGNVHFWKCIIVLVICCQQFGEYVLIETIGWYWIYDAPLVRHSKYN